MSTATTTATTAVAAASPNRGLTARRLVMGVCFLLPCILIELLVMTSCYIMLKQATNPATAVIGGLGIVAVVLMGVELLKIPFAIASAAAPQRWIQGLALVLFLVVSVSTAETLMTGISKNYELSQEPAVRAIEDIDDGERRIADAENSIRQISDVSLRVEAMVAERRAEATAELERIAADRSARLAEFDQRTAEVREGPGLQPLERDRLEAIEQTIRDRREQMRQSGPNAARIAAIAEERTALMASKSEATRTLNAQLTAVGQQEQSELAGISSLANERRAAATAERNAELARIDQSIAAFTPARQEVITRRDTLIAEHRSKDRAFYKLESKIAAANQEADVELARLDEQVQELRDQRKAFLSTEDPRVAVDAWHAEQTAAVRERSVGERQTLRTASEGSLVVIAERLETLQSEETRLTAADTEALRDRAERFETEIAEAEDEAAELRAAAAARMAAAGEQIQATLAEIEARRQHVAGELDAAAAAVVAARDERIATLESRAMTPEQAAVRRGELEATIATARERITEASRTRDRSRKDSIVYNLARIVAETDDPTRAEVQWTLKWLIPIAAFIVAVAPAVGVKLAMHAVFAEAASGTAAAAVAAAARPRRRRSRSALKDLRTKVAEHEMRRREAAERKAAEAAAAAEKAATRAAEAEQHAERHRDQTDRLRKENLSLREDFTNFVSEHRAVIECLVGDHENRQAPASDRNGIRPRATIE